MLEQSCSNFWIQRNPLLGLLLGTLCFESQLVAFLDELDHEARIDGMENVPKVVALHLVILRFPVVR